MGVFYDPGLPSNFVLLLWSGKPDGSEDYSNRRQIVFDYNYY